MKQEPLISIILTVSDSTDNICKTIGSVKGQSLIAYECIIILEKNAGNICDEARQQIEGDSRFRIVRQEMTDIAAAWNNSLSAASGKYILFLDSRECLNHKALATMHEKASKKDADLVIGNILYSELGETHENSDLKRLCMREYIHPFDRDLICNTELGNKLFRRSIIAGNHIAFAKADGYEGLWFFLRYIGYCKVITGCNVSVGSIELLPYWIVESCSATKAYNAEAFSKCIDAAALSYSIKREEIMRDASPIALQEPDRVAEHDIRIKELDVQYDRLKSALYSRFVRNDLIDAAYRYPWTYGEETIEDVLERIAECKEHIFPMDWQEEVLEKTTDLPLVNNSLPDRATLRESTALTFAISGPGEKEKLNIVLKGIYRQNYPLFEVLINKELLEKVDPEFRLMENLRYVDPDEGNFRKAAFEAAKGRYIWFIDQGLYLGTTSVSRMIEIISESSDYLFVSAPMTSIRDGNSVRIDANAVSFIPEFARRKLRTDYNQLDYFWCNKLFSVAKLKALKEPFGKDSWDTLERFYKYSIYKKTNDISLLTDYTDEDILKQVRSNTVAATWESKLREEEEFLKNLEARNKRESSAEEKRRNVKATRRKLLFRWLTIRVIYPLMYCIFSIRRVEQGKVLFVEPSQLKPTNSMQTLINAVREAGFNNVMQISLAHNKVRKREQFRRELNFLREFATAEFVFTTEALSTVGGFRKRKETTLVNLWHGCGAFKRFGNSTAELKFGNTVQENLKYPGYRNLDLITVSSPEVIWAYEEAMNYKDADVVKATGISRTDVFFNQDYIAEAKARVLEEVPEATGKKIILYAPTFRGSVRRAKAPDRLDIQALHEALGDDYYLMIKHHPHVKVRPLVPVDCKGFARDVTTEATIDDLLCCTDICISDYSSLVFEYSLFGKPMIFFAYDLEEYNDWRGFYYDYDELTPGPVVMSNEEIIRYVRNIDTEFDKDAVDRFRDRFMSSCDGHATQRILETIGMVQ